jgi:hypothetical protein
VTVDVIKAFQQETNITIVWKTSGFIQESQNSAMHNLARVMNSRVMDRIDALRANDVTAKECGRSRGALWIGIAAGPASNDDQPSPGFRVLRPAN